MPIISTNTTANTALLYLNSNSADESSALAKLSSGSNITKASDDAAGLAIGTLLQSESDSMASDTKYNGQSLLDGTSQFASGVSFMVGTSSADSITVTLDSANASALGVTGTDVSTQADAETALTAINAAIDTISSQRATVGADESRFNFQSQNISTMNENTTSAESAIMDADVAAEKSKVASDDVKSQAAMAALAQANAMPKELL